jgi:hypothetical protein
VKRRGPGFLNSKTWSNAGAPGNLRAVGDEIDQWCNRQFRSLVSVQPKTMMQVFTADIAIKCIELIIMISYTSGVDRSARRNHRSECL